MHGHHGSDGRPTNASRNNIQIVQGIHYCSVGAVIAKPGESASTSWDHLRVTFRLNKRYLSHLIEDKYLACADQHAHRTDTMNSKIIISADGSKIYAEASGDPRKPSIVFIHGFSLCGAVFDNIFANEDFGASFYLVCYVAFAPGYMDY